MLNQLSILDAIETQSRADAGLCVAVAKAESEVPDWKANVWELFISWLQSKPIGYTFLMEEFRNDIQHELTGDYSPRAFGFVSKKALRENFVKHAGFGKVSNVKAHGANASRWMKK